MIKKTYLLTRCFREKCKSRDDCLYCLYNNVYFTTGGYNHYAKYGKPCEEGTYKGILSIYTKLRRYMIRELVHLDLDPRIRVAAYDMRGRIEDWVENLVQMFLGQTVNTYVHTPLFNENKTYSYRMSYTVIWVIVLTHIILNYITSKYRLKYKKNYVIF